MVCEWGMSEKLGPLSYEKREGPVFLGMNYSQSTRDISDSKAEEIDKEVYELIDSGYKLALKILTDNRDALERLALALLEYETIDSHEVEMLVNGAAVSEVRKVRSNKIANQTPGGGVEIPVKTGGSDPVGNTGPVTA
jgi:cell division protease FtsH